jgi:precorrin-3B synthase
VSQIGAGSNRTAANNAVVWGWCPDAWRPMTAGDGLLVRVKPRLGRLSAQELAALCEAAIAYGNGLIDVTRRANLQIRGVREEGWRPLLDTLLGWGLVDNDARREGARTMLVAPDWREDDDSHRIADELLQRLDELPDLPGKCGFIIDAGAEPVLLREPGDFRIERGADGGLMLRADGRALGVSVDRRGAVDALIALARWFVSSDGARAGRMIRHDAPLPVWATGAVTPAQSRPPLVPGPWDRGMAYGLAFGRVEARALMQAGDVRITPWRILLVEGEASGLPADPADGSLMRIEACPGAPDCPQASVETRDLARRLAAHITGRLHVSGCAKGCASSLPADIVLTGRDGRYDLAFDARAGAEPVRPGLSFADLLAHFGAH